MFAAKSSVNLKTGVVILFAISFLYSSHTLMVTKSSGSTRRPQTEYERSLANSTLGFGQIFALSVENQTSPLAWRQKGLISAANLTGLDIEIFKPETDPPLSWYQSLPLRANQDDVKEDERVRLPIGTALSLLGHMSLLQKIVDSGVSTALIIEDDADWDVHIREQLKPNGTIASALRNFDPEDMRQDIKDAPFGLDWDILHLGHCHYNLPAKIELYVDDPTAPDMSKVRAAWSHTHYAGFPAGQRGIFQGASGICVFGYGITQAGAKRLLELNKWDNMIDSIFWDRCKDGGLRCNVIAPELIHHQRAVGTQSTRLAMDQGIAPKKPERFFTMNIPYSARCNAQHDTGYPSPDPESGLVQCHPSAEEFVTLPD